MAKRDEEAGIYDGLFPAMHNFIEIPPIVDALRLRPHDRVLDVGAGTGRILREYAPHCERIVAVDFSMESLRILRRSLPPPVRDRVALVHADVCGLPVRAGRFSRVVCTHVLQHLPTNSHRERAVANMNAALQPGGVIVMTVYNWSLMKRLAARRAADPPGLGNRRDGHHPDGQISFHNMTARELRQLLGRSFRVNRVFGLLQRIRGLHRLGVCRPVVERIIEHTPCSLWASQFLVARAEKLAVHVRE